MAFASLGDLGLPYNSDLFNYLKQEVFPNPYMFTWKPSGTTAIAQSIWASSTSGGTGSGSGIITYTYTSSSVPTPTPIIKKI